MHEATVARSVHPRALAKSSPCDALSAWLGHRIVGVPLSMMARWKSPALPGETM